MFEPKNMSSVSRLLEPATIMKKRPIQDEDTGPKRI